MIEEVDILQHGECSTLAVFCIEYSCLLCVSINMNSSINWDKTASYFFLNLLYAYMSGCHFFRGKPISNVFSLEKILLYRNSPISYIPNIQKVLVNQKCGRFQQTLFIFGGYFFLFLKKLYLCKLIFKHK